MPKQVTDAEKNRIKDLMYLKGIELIKTKGLKKVTVEDISKACGIGKGSFYLYYNSKEKLLYDILKRCEKSLFERIENQRESVESLKERFKMAIREIYLAPDSLVLYVSPTDLENLLYKLPEEVFEVEKAKSQDYFARALALFEIDQVSCDIQVLAQLMDALCFLATNNNNYYADGIPVALEVLISAIAGYATGEDN